MMEKTLDAGLRNGHDCLIVECKRVGLKMLLWAQRNAPGGGSIVNDLYPGQPAGAEECRGIARSLVSCVSDHGVENHGADDLDRLLADEEAAVAGKGPDGDAGLRAPLHELQHMFGLSAFEMDVLLVGILPEIDPDFERYFAYLQDDITRKTPTAGLVLKLLCERFEDTLTARRIFCSDAPLIKNGLIHLSPGYGRGETTLPAKFVRVDERISRYLIGINEIDRRLRSFASIYRPGAALQDVLLPAELKERLLRLAAGDGEIPPVYHFHGTAGAGKRTAAMAVCGEIGMPLLIVEAKPLLAAETPAAESLPLVFREGRLQGASLYLEGSDLLFGSDGPDAGDIYYSNLLAELDDFPHPVFLGSEKMLEFRRYPQRRPLFTIGFTPPAHRARKQLWLRQTADDVRLSPDIDFDDIAGKFRLTAGQIADAVAAARSLALWREPGNALVTSDDLYLVCRQQSRRRLNTLTNQAESRYDWDDIILPKDQKEQLMEICSQVKYRGTVYNDWGFGRKLTRGKGLNVLFSGPSGTGKTMAAEIMGNELGIDLYKIDLSVIVSKYIGETEKNLDRIFREGTTANAIIFFDEADSLFGKRSEVRDAHDRYANIEISYLLQKIEDYDGVIILATNLRKNMDDAFARRMHFAIEFPVPDEPDRYRIWRSMFPAEAPLGQDLDIDFLARQFQVTGGNIRNIALASAFLAAQDGGVITMSDIIRATRREYQKMGKLCTETDFAHYFGMVRG